MILKIGNGMGKKSENLTDYLEQFAYELKETA